MICYFLVMAERKRIRENSTEIIIANAAFNEFPERVVCYLFFNGTGGPKVGILIWSNIQKLQTEFIL